MATLTQMLQYLQRNDVSEIVFQTDSQPLASVAGKPVALSNVKLTARHMDAVLASPGLSHPVPAEDGSHERTIAVGPANYRVLVRRAGPRVQVRFSKPPGAPGKNDTIDETHAVVVRPDDTTSDHPTDTPSVHIASEHSAARAASAAESQHAPETVTYTPVAAATAPDRELVEILTKARARGASDVHVMAGRHVSIRISGQLLTEELQLSAERVEKMLMTLMDSFRRDQLTKRGYTDFGLDVPNAGRLRVNVGRQSTGLKGCFRLTPPTIPTFEELGMPEELNKIVMYHQGLVVVSGPSGQGKTTTLAALVNKINTSKADHIITVEDPVEFLFPVSKSLVSQREIGRHTLSFHRALKGALREDPDIIVIGELRDAETVEIALEAAETGHLVITTMSTRSGAKTIDRLIDMFPPDKQSQVRATLAGALKLIVSQRLLPSPDGTKLHAAAEMLTGATQLWNLIRDNKLLQLPSLMQRGRSLGMIRFDESLEQLFRQQKISEQTALEFADNPVDLKKQLQIAATASASANATAGSTQGAVPSANAGAAPRHGAQPTAGAAVAPAQRKPGTGTGPVAVPGQPAAAPTARRGT